MIILPRQARDKHRESTQKKTVLLQSGSRTKTTFRQTISCWRCSYGWGEFDKATPSSAGGSFISLIGRQLLACCLLLAAAWCCLVLLGAAAVLLQYAFLLLLCCACACACGCDCACVRGAWLGLLIGTTQVCSTRRTSVRKTPLFEQFIHENDDFTKTGSGQT